LHPMSEIEYQPGSSSQRGSSGGLHPKLVAALSQIPYSAHFGVFWPIIVEQASYDTREVLRNVNTYFKKLCYPYRRSDRAKRVR
jgi:hypothetical protein